nr:unnamed protein product [Rangifer tarandus platyrhynchus]
MTADDSNSPGARQVPVEQLNTSNLKEREQKSRGTILSHQPENTPSQPVMYSEAWCSMIYCEAACMSNGTFGTSSPSTILSVIIIGLMGGVYFFPALRFSAQDDMA